MSSRDRREAAAQADSADSYGARRSGIRRFCCGLALRWLERPPDGARTDAPLLLFSGDRRERSRE
jgi:hypothetical protein